METNEAVAKACGFTVTNAFADGTVVVLEFHQKIRSCSAISIFDPATDPAAALFALEAYSEKWSLSYVIHGGVNQSFNVGFYGEDLPTYIKEFYVTEKTIESAICAAILTAEGIQNG